MKPTHFELISMAMAEFQRNADTLVASWIIKHPDVDPADVELVVKHEADGMRFYIAPKELHVPPEKLPPMIREESDDGSPSYSEAYRQGWNDARAAVVAMAKTYRGPEAQVASLVTAQEPVPATPKLVIVRG